jgi:sugar lactone lactonase YvrE
VATRPGYRSVYPGAVELALDAKAALAEGPRWDARIARLLWVDIDGCALHRFDPATGEDEATPLPAKVGSASPTPDPDRILVALADRLAIVDVRSGELEPVVDLPHAHPGLRANDGAIDPTGRFWIGTMAEDESPDKGALYRLAGGELTTVLEPVSLSNGLDWAGDRMYYIDSPTKRIDVMDYDGEVGNRRPFAHIEEGVGVPDGLVVDDEGGVWVALYGGAQVRRYSPDGELTEKLAVPADNVTAAWFAGNRLFITTARSPQPLGGSLFVTEPGVTGRAARIFAG